MSTSPDFFATSHPVSVLEFRLLLTELRNLQPHTCVRLRRLGEMWFPAFMRIDTVTDKGVVFSDESSENIHVVENLITIMQFEIDQCFRAYQPHFHYDVVPSFETR